MLSVTNEYVLKMSLYVVVKTKIIRRTIRNAN
jgi:hypothetical protein